MNRNRTFTKLIGDFDSEEMQLFYQLLEGLAPLYVPTHGSFLDNSFLTQSRNEVPQTFQEYLNTQIKMKSAHPKISKLKLV
jgi:hypothetical protein